MILLDTHVVLWLAQDYRQISPAAQTAIEDARKKNRGLAICDIVFAEIARLVTYGRIHLTPDAGTFLREIESRFVVLPITANVALEAFSLPARYPKDPADRIIGATALIEDIPLVTADRQIRKSRVVPVIW